MKAQHKNMRVGELRPTQLLFTFGIGSLLDLPNLSALVMGLDDWDEGRCRPINEERLLKAVSHRLGSRVLKLSLPPIDDEENGPTNPLGPQIGVPVAPYPRWFRCPACDLLAPIDSDLFQLKIDPYYPDRTAFVHATCRKRTNPVAVPVRFLVACKNGHLDDFPWVDYVHAKGGTCKNMILRYREFGVSGAAEDIEVSCESCNARHRLGDALGSDAKDHLPACKGRHPHLRRYDDTACTEPLKTILLGASNSWFPITLSVIAIPRATDKLARLVEAHWVVLQEADSLGTLKAFRKIGQLGAFAEYTDEVLWAAMEAQKALTAEVVTEEAADLKTPEWEVLSDPNAQFDTEDFSLNEVKPPSGFAPLISRVVQVVRLREVRALVGFTRIESPGEFAEVGESQDDRLSPLARKTPEWVPASEVRGEGIFIQFDEERLSAWLKTASVKARSLRFFEAHKLWRQARNIIPEEAGFPGMRYVFLHSFTHALMRQLSLDCGYTASSIRERIYSRNDEDAKGAMAGVLIYTAAPDSEGTLGGLVSLGEPEKLEAHLIQALEQMTLCASDPLCSEHDPAKEGITLHGSACHACMFSPETSCERGNRYLDRATLVETFTAQGVSYFPGK